MEGEEVVAAEQPEEQEEPQPEEEPEHNVEESEMDGDETEEAQEQEEPPPDAQTIVEPEEEAPEEVGGNDGRGPQSSPDDLTSVPNEVAAETSEQVSEAPPENVTEGVAGDSEAPVQVAASPDGAQEIPVAAEYDEANEPDNFEEQPLKEEPDHARDEEVLMLPPSAGQNSVQPPGSGNSNWAGEMQAVPSTASSGTRASAEERAHSGYPPEGVTQGSINEVLAATHDLPAALEVEVDMGKIFSDFFLGENLFSFFLFSKIGPSEPPRIVHVTVVTETFKKPFLGGFRHKHTQIEYHHATSQTERDKKKEDTKPTIKFHRDTQTVTYKSRSQQNYREYGTQMPRADVDVDTNDYYILPRSYMDSDLVGDLKLKKAIVIQCYARGMFARTRARRLWKELVKSREEAEEAARRQREEAEEKQRREVERRMHPRTESDFDVLYEELEQWRQLEAENVRKRALDQKQKRVENYQLLSKEVKLVQTIDRLKTVAAKENREAKIERQLEMMSEAKLWEMSDGTVASVHTPFTTRAKELMDLYMGLKLKNVSVDDRLDVLLHVKWTVKEFEAPLTLELEELIDREADLLNRNRSDKSLENLRKRILNLFLDFIETPEYNPEAGRFKKVFLFPVFFFSALNPHAQNPQFSTTLGSMTAELSEAGGSRRSSVGGTSMRYLARSDVMTASSRNDASSVQQTSRSMS